MSPITITITWICFQMDHVQRLYERLRLSAPERVIATDVISSSTGITSPRRPGFARSHTFAASTTTTTLPHVPLPVPVASSAADPSFGRSYKLSHRDVSFLPNDDSNMESTLHQKTQTKESGAHKQVSPHPTRPLAYSYPLSSDQTQGTEGHKERKYGWIQSTPVLPSAAKKKAAHKEDEKQEEEASSSGVSSQGEDEGRVHLPRPVRSGRDEDDLGDGMKNRTRPRLDEQDTDMTTRSRHDEQDMKTTIRTRHDEEDTKTTTKARHEEKDTKTTTRPRHEEYETKTTTRPRHDEQDTKTTPRRDSVDILQLCEHLRTQGLGDPLLSTHSHTGRHRNSLPPGVKARCLPKNPSTREKIKGRARLDYEMANMRAAAFCEQQHSRAFRTASADLRDRDVRLLEEEERENVQRDLHGDRGHPEEGENEGEERGRVVEEDDDASSLVGSPLSREELFLRIEAWADDVHNALHRGHS